MDEMNWQEFLHGQKKSLLLFPDFFHIAINWYLTGAKYL